MYTFISELLSRNVYRKKSIFILCVYACVRACVRVYIYIYIIFLLIIIYYMPIALRCLICFACDCTYAVICTWFYKFFSFFFLSPPSVHVVDFFRYVDRSLYKYLAQWMNPEYWHPNNAYSQGYDNVANNWKYLKRKWFLRYDNETFGI